MIVRKDLNMKVGELDMNFSEDKKVKNFLKRQNFFYKFGQKVIDSVA